MQTLAGHVTEEDGFRIEVWISTLPDGEVEHVFLMYGGSQMGDFPFNQPRQDDELELAAQMIAADPDQKEITLPLLIMDD